MVKSDTRNSNHIRNVLLWSFCFLFEGDFHTAQLWDNIFGEKDDCDDSEEDDDDDNDCDDESVNYQNEAGNYLIEAQCGIYLKSFF